VIIVGIWISSLSRIDKSRIWHNIFTRKSLESLREIFMESLLHRKIFRKNAVLGYMHMSLAFGWFLLIVVGHIDACNHFQSLSVPAYKAIFFRFYISEAATTLSGKILAAQHGFIACFCSFGSYACLL